MLACKRHAPARPSKLTIAEPRLRGHLLVAGVDCHVEFMDHRKMDE